MGSSPRMLFNADCNTFFYDPQLWQPEGGPYSAQAIHRYVRAVAGLGFDTLVINPNCQVPWHPSKTLRSMLDGYTRGNADFFRDPTQPAVARQYAKLCDLYLDLLEAGVDWLAETARACRQCGLTPWLSVRMNDMHQAHATDAPEHCDLFRDPAMRLSGRTPDPAASANPATPGGLDYGKRAVRDYMFELIRAVVADYDFEGLELDWLRTPQCCKPNPPQADVDMISAWHAELRSLTQARAQRTGRPYAFGMRSLPCLGQMRSVGLDVAGMARAGLLDFVVASNVHQATWDEPFDRLRQELGPKVRLFGVINTEPNWLPCHDPAGGVIGTRRMHTTPELVRGNAAGKWVLGADGIESFNFFLQPDPSLPEPANRRCLEAWKEIGSLAALRGKDKQYTLSTMRQGRVREPNEDYFEQLPALLAEHQRRAFHLPMCAEPAENAMELIVQIVVARDTGLAPIGVSFNGSWPVYDGKPTDALLFRAVSRKHPPDAVLTRHAPAHQAFDFRFPAGAIRDGWNDVTVYYGGLAPAGAAASSRPPLRIQSIELAAQSGAQSAGY